MNHTLREKVAENTPREKYTAVIFSGTEEFIVSHKNEVECICHFLTSLGNKGESN